MDQSPTESPLLTRDQPVSAAHGRTPASACRGAFSVRFCLERADIGLNKLTEALQRMGQCLAVEGDERVLRVHLCVQDPGAPLSFVVQHGYVTGVQVENLATVDEASAREDGAHAEAVSGAGELTFSTTPDSTIEDEIALVAQSLGAGFANILRTLGVETIIAADAASNPTQEELARILRTLPNQRILFLPNNGDMLVTANQVAEILAEETPARTVMVANTKTMPQVIAALSAWRAAHDDLATGVAQIQERCAQIDTGVVTQAIRGAEFDGIAVEVGHFIGLHDGRLVTRNSDLDDVVLALLEQMAADDSRTITIYYGDFISAEAAENLRETVRNRYADQSVALAYGGQAHSHYILSTE